MRAHRIFLVFLLAATPVVSYSDWGGEIRLGHWEADGEELQKDLDNSLADPTVTSPKHGFLDRESLNWEAGGFYERDLRADWRWGLSLGYGVMASAEQKFFQTAANPDDSPSRIKDTASYFPLSVYAKRALPFKSLSVSAGLGVGYLKALTELRSSGPGYDISGNFRRNKFIPHAQAGLEYGLTRRISIGLDIKYLFFADVDDLQGSLAGDEPGDFRLTMQSDTYGEFISASKTSDPLAPGERLYRIDFGGPRVNLSLRYYFGKS